MADVTNSKVPVLIAVVMIVAGLAIAAAHGITHGSVGGGVLAAAGALPGVFGMWKGIQQETQGTLALSVAAVLAALAVGAVLIVLGVVNWVV
jgi:hypothetical protein|nr:hypothetical protein [Kofleriaceae bacterium]